MAHRAVTRYGETVPRETNFVEFVLPVSESPTNQSAWMRSPFEISSMFHGGSMLSPVLLMTYYEWEALRVRAAFFADADRAAFGRAAAAFPPFLPPFRAGA